MESSTVPPENPISVFSPSHLIAELDDVRNTFNCASDEYRDKVANLIRDIKSVLSDAEQTSAVHHAAYVLLVHILDASNPREVVGNASNSSYRMPHISSLMKNSLAQTDTIPFPPSTPKVTPTIKNATPEWKAALAAAGLTQGSGKTRSDVIYCGAHTLHRQPDLIPITIDISSTLTIQRMTDIQMELLAAFAKMTWHGRRGTNNDCYFRLHPWAAVAWVNFFTGETLGIEGLKKINQVLATPRIPTPSANNDDTTRASKLADRADLTTSERNFYHVLSQTTDGTFPTRSNRTNAIYLAEYRMLLELFHNLSDSIRHPLSDFEPGFEPDHVESLTPTRNRPSGDGRDRMMAACADNMAWSLSQVEQHLTKHKFHMLCAQHFSVGFLFVSDENSFGRIEKLGNRGLGEIFRIVNKVFPQLYATCVYLGGILSDRAGPMSPVIHRDVNGQQLSIEPGPPSMLSRVKALVQTERSIWFYFADKTRDIDQETSSLTK